MTKPCFIVQSLPLSSHSSSLYYLNNVERKEKKNRHYIIKPRWLKHLWDHENLFKTLLVQRTNRNSLGISFLSAVK